jgi:hypothetical protein
MAMDDKQFREAVLIYGADVRRWPDDLRHAGLDALASSLDCRSFRDEHARFETVLASRALEAPRADFARRIIAAARPRERKGFRGLVELVASYFADLRVPAPVVTVTAVLVVGFVVGLLLPAESTLAESDVAEAQMFFDAETEAL